MVEVTVDLRNGANTSGSEITGAFRPSWQEQRNGLGTGSFFLPNPLAATISVVATQHAVRDREQVAAEPRRIVEPREPVDAREEGLLHQVVARRVVGLVAKEADHALVVAIEQPLPRVGVPAAPRRDELDVGAILFHPHMIATARARGLSVARSGRGLLCDQKKK